MQHPYAIARMLFSNLSCLYGQSYGVEEGCYDVKYITTIMPHIYLAHICTLQHLYVLWYTCCPLYSVILVYSPPCVTTQALCYRKY
jgi:hypothetical protein